MSNYADPKFGHRIRDLEHRHHKLVRGAVTEMRPDGLLVLRPRRFSVARFVWPLVIVCMMGVGFKILTLASVGEITYVGRIEKLEHGTQFERAAARLVAIDPVTRWGAAQLRLYTPLS